MKPFDWFEWYMWLKMAFKMSQEIPTKDFHVLHSAYVYICYSILQAKTGEPTIRAACTPQTVCDRHFFLAIFPAVLLYPQQSVPTLHYIHRHVPSAVPWIFEDHLLPAKCNNTPFHLRKDVFSRQHAVRRMDIIKYDWYNIIWTQWHCKIN